MFKGKAAATAAVRALTHLGIVLQWSYRLSRPPPAGSWRRVHAVYAFAKQIEVADKAIPAVERLLGHLSRRTTSGRFIAEIDGLRFLSH